MTDSGVPIEPSLINFLSAGVPWRVAVVVRHHDLSTGTFDRLGDLPGALGIDRQRLLDHHVDAGIQRPHDQFGVRVVG